MYIDTHCHLSIEDYNDIDKVIEENKDALVEKIVVSGCSRESIEEVMDLKDKYDMIYVTIGYHPEYADTITKSDLDYLKSLLGEKKIIGIGEIGLDYHYTKENKDKQIWLFEEQLKIADAFNLPVVIHSRDATMDTINILKKYKAKGIIHSLLSIGRQMSGPFLESRAQYAWEDKCQQYEVLSAFPTLFSELLLVKR